MVVSYLRKRLGITREEAQALAPLAFRAVEGYLTAIGGDGLEGSEIDKLDVKFRLEKPFVFGHFARVVMEDAGIPEEMKDRIAIEAYSTIDFQEYEDDMLPAYLLNVLHRLVRMDGMAREYFEMVLIAFDANPDVLKASTPQIAEELYSWFLGSNLLSDEEKSLLLGIISSSGGAVPETVSDMAEMFLASTKVSMKEKRRFASSFVDVNYSTRFWTDRTKESDIIETRPIRFSEDVTALLRNEALEWMELNLNDKQGSILAYLDANPNHTGAGSKYKAALMMMKRFNTNLPEEFVRSSIVKACEFPDDGVKALAEATGYDLFGDEFSTWNCSHTDRPKRSEEPE